MTRATLVIILTLLALAAVSLIFIVLARGYNFNLQTKSFTPTGILVLTSDPDGAEVRVNGDLKTATNTTMNLSPGDYTIKIEKDGFSPWEKKLTLKAEEVYKTNAFLFPKVPDLRPMTYSGALSPTLSPDGTKVAFTVASAAAERNGVFVADLSRSSLPGPLSNTADLRQITRDTPFLVLSQMHLLWSPDSRQLLAYLSPFELTIATPSATVAYLLDTDRLNEAPRLVTFELPDILKSWDNQRKTQETANLAKLDLKLSQFLATFSGKVELSPDQTKLLYQATASATLPPITQSYIPGTNPTPENRELVVGQIYVYDLKEDRNYHIPGSWQITNRYPFVASTTPDLSNQISWFPSSRHLMTHTTSEISLLEYDGTNKSVIYGGPFRPGLVFPWPNWGRVTILTSLNSLAGIGENLYTINLR